VTRRCVFMVETGVLTLEIETIYLSHTVGFGSGSPDASSTGIVGVFATICSDTQGGVFRLDRE